MENKIQTNETIKEYFERRTRHKITDYIAEHMANALNKNGKETFLYALDVTLDRHEIMEFETPTDFIRYMYAVCRNRILSNNWESVE